MDVTLIFEGKATLEELYDLHEKKKGYDVIARAGKVVEVHG